MSGLLGRVVLQGRAARPAFPHKPGHILHDVLETRMMPDLTGPVGRGTLQYTAVWKAAQRLTTRPVKFGTIMPELIAMAVRDLHYKDLSKAILAISDALNEELHELADAGCRVIQMEEPQIHLLAAKGLVDKVLNPDFMVEVFNNTVRGLRAKTEVWCHTCWGNPAAQRLFAKPPSYAPALEPLSRSTPTSSRSRPAARAAWTSRRSASSIKDKKVCIGVVDHHTLQVETPEQVAALIRKALEHIPAERLILGSDCGMGREGMSRRHAFYKMVSIVPGTNLVRRERELPEASLPSPYSMIEADFPMVEEAK